MNTTVPPPEGVDMPIPAATAYRDQRVTPINDCLRRGDGPGALAAIKAFEGDGRPDLTTIFLDELLDRLGPQRVGELFAATAPDQDLTS